ncbi:glycosyl hydrolase, partial [Corallococcus sp. CA041A]|uniref:fibronectin type III-like domain-contianing protein n=1 Tax=Corallococcus sp. CA041A TaxID=2316727 RepID=UPI000EB9E312
LYVGFPASAGTPPRQLRGFEKLPLAAGDSTATTFELRRRDISVWDTAAQEWTVPAGEFNITVGASSRDLRLSTTLTIS